MYMWHMYMNVDKYVYTRTKATFVSYQWCLKECTVFALAKVTVVYIIPQFSDILKLKKNPSY